MWGDYRPVLVYGFAVEKDFIYSLDEIHNAITEFASTTAKGYGFDLIYGVEIDLQDYKIKSFKHVDILAESVGKKADYHLCIIGDFETRDMDSKDLEFDKETIKRVSEAYKEYLKSESNRNDSQNQPHHQSLNKSASDSSSNSLKDSSSIDSD